MTDRRYHAAVLRYRYRLLSLFYAAVDGHRGRDIRAPLLAMLDLRPGEHVLEVGPGSGRALADLARRVWPGGTVDGLDLSAAMLRLSQAHVRRRGLSRPPGLVQGNAMHIPFADETFTAIYMSGVLELFGPDQIPRVLQEVRRVMAPAGRLGVASLSRNDLEAWAAFRCYDWLQQRVLGGWSCRPLSVIPWLEDSGFRILCRRTVRFGRLVPVTLAVAGPGPG